MGAPDAAAAHDDAVSNPPQPPLRLQLLRAPQLLHGDGSATPLNANDAALLALLAVDGPTTRERAMAMLWPDESDPARARNALRQRLFRLRRAAGCELVSGEALLALAPAIEHDVSDDSAKLRTALAANPGTAAAGELLGHEAFDGQAEFSTWLATAREQWRSRRRDALADMASKFEAQDRIAEALACAERLVHDEPLLEHAHRRLMRLHYRRGDRAAALATFAHLSENLRLQLGEKPSTETRELAQLIEASGVLPVAASNAGPAALALMRPPQLIGRKREWQQMQSACAQGRTVFIIGEPGIGKSRLLGDFATQGWVSVAARPGDARLPFALLARLVQAVIATTAANAELAPWAAAELARLMPALGVAATGRIDMQRLLQAVELAIVHARLAGVAVDDLQFADEATLDLMPALAASGVGGHWLFAFRANEQPAAVTAWIGALDVQRMARIELGPLDQNAVAELLASLALPGLDAAGWAPRLHRHTGGNPMFILETLRALGQGDSALTTALPLPENLRLLIDRRLAQLLPLALKLARVAALAGSDFSVDLAAEVLGVHALDLHDAWQELEAAHVMQGGAFAHDLIFEAMRDSVPLALRQWLHQRIATWLQAHQGAAVRLALHWRDAGEPARASLCFAQAAEEARAAGHLAEQTRWLKACIEAHALAGQADARFEAMVRLAIAAREALSPLAAMQAAQSLVSEAVDERQRGIGHLQVASCHMNAARFDLALPAFEAAITAATSAGDEHTAQHSRYLQALATAQVLGLPEALSRIERLIPWAEAQADESLRHSFFADLAILYDQADQRKRARPYFERALAYFDRTREVGNAAPTRMMFARSLVMLGDLAQARTLLEQAVRDRAELSEGEGGQGIEALNLARVYCELGHYGAALALLEPWLERLSAPGSDVVRAAMALVMARIYAHLGQAARAMALFKAVPELAPFHLQAGLLWVRALLAQERPAERARLLDEALAQFNTTDLPFIRLPILFDRLACEPGADAVKKLRAGVADCEKRELPAPQMLGRMRLVQVLLARGARGDSATALTVARGLIDDLAHVQPVGTYLPELYAACRAAAQAERDTTLARRCQDAAVRWIAVVSQAHVPEHFRDSFAHRNPVNRAVLTATLDA